MNENTTYATLEFSDKHLCDEFSTYALLAYNDEQNEQSKHDHVVDEVVPEKATETALSKCSVDCAHEECTVKILHHSYWYHGTWDAAEITEVLLKEYSANNNINYLVYRSERINSFVILFKPPGENSVRKFAIDWIVPKPFDNEDGSFELIESDCSWKRKHHKHMYNGVYRLNIRWRGKTLTFRVARNSSGDLFVYKFDDGKDSDVPVVDKSFKDFDNLFEYYSSHKGILPCVLKRLCSKHYFFGNVKYFSLYSIIHHYMVYSIACDCSLLSPCPPSAGKCKKSLKSTKKEPKQGAFSKLLNRRKSQRNTKDGDKAEKPAHDSAKPQKSTNDYSKADKASPDAAAAVVAVPSDDNQKPSHGRPCNDYAKPLKVDKAPADAAVASAAVPSDDNQKPSYGRPCDDYSGISNYAVYTPKEPSNNHSNDYAKPLKVDKAPVDPSDDNQKPSD